MPTSGYKNVLYRILLPFCAPSCGKKPIVSLSGHSLSHCKTFERFLHRHHVIGSATLIRSENQSALICTGSDRFHKATPDMYFRVASITKMATAILSMRMIENQTIDPDRPISDYFSSISDEGALKGITINHLLSHTSGLIDPPDLESALENGSPFPDILNHARRFSPGSMFQYSNLGFGLIGCLMEVVLCQPVGEIFHEYLFSPLGMNATLEGCLLPAYKIMPVTRVLPYHRNRETILTKLGSKPLLQPDPFRHYGHTAGSMYTDIVSLQKLLDVLIRNDGRFLSEKSVRLMTSAHASYGSASPSLSYGYGILRINDATVSDGLVFGHQGFAYGCVDGAFWEEKTGRSLIMLNGGASEARNGRLGLLNRDLLRWAFRRELPSW